MKKFIGFVVKETYHIFRDKRSLVILFGMPIAQILLFGFAIRSEINDAKIVILDHSKDAITKEIKQKILSSGYFLLQEEVKTNEDINRVFRQGKVKQALIFESNFAQKLYRNNRSTIQVVADASDPNTASILTSYAQAIVSSYQMQNPDLFAADRSAQVNLTSDIRMYYNPELKSVFMFVPGIMAVILMLISAMMTSISIAREKELGTMEILLVSPLRPSLIIIGKVLPYLVLSFINAIVILALGYFVFGMPINGSLTLLLAESLLFILMALSLGILISTVAASQQVAMMLSLFALMMPSILLSGFVFSIDSMPTFLQVFSNVIPARWFLEIIKSIMLKGVGIEFIWKETLILAGLTLFFIALSVRKFKVRLA